MKFNVMCGDGSFFGIIDINPPQVHRLMGNDEILVFEPMSPMSDDLFQNPVTVSMSCMSINEEPPPAVHSNNVFEEKTNGV